jgi:hypothetical protein
MTNILFPAKKGLLGEIQNLSYFTNISIDKHEITYFMIQNNTKKLFKTKKYKLSCKNVFRIDNMSKKIVKNLFASSKCFY